MILGDKALEMLLERVNKALDDGVKENFIPEEDRNALKPVLEQVFKLRNTTAIGTVATFVAVNLDAITFDALKLAVSKIPERMVMTNTMAYLEDPDTKVD